MFSAELSNALTNLEQEGGRRFLPASSVQLKLLISSAADEIALLIDSNQDGSIDFDEYSQHTKTIKLKQDQIRQYAKVILTNDMTLAASGHVKLRPRASLLTRVRRTSNMVRSSLLLLNKQQTTAVVALAQDELPDATKLNTITEAGDVKKKDDTIISGNKRASAAKPAKKKKGQPTKLATTSKPKRSSKTCPEG